VRGPQEHIVRGWSLEYGVHGLPEERQPVLEVVLRDFRNPRMGSHWVSVEPPGAQQDARPEVAHLSEVLVPILVHPGLEDGPQHRVVPHIVVKTVDHG